MARSTALARGEGSAQLTEAQEQAAELLARGRRVGDVAEAAGVTPATIAEWQQVPVFVAAVNAQLADARESTRQRLRALAGPALDVVEAALTEDTTPAAIRLQLAVKVLELIGAGELVKQEIGSSDPGDVEADQQSAARTKALMRF